MRTVGSLLLLFGLALFTIIGTSSVGEVLDGVNETDTPTAENVKTAISPLFTVMGFLVLIVGGFIVIDSFR